VQLARIVFEYIKKQTAPWAQKNKCFQTMHKVITVILLLFEKVLKYITKNAYIMIAMQGHAFCDAACHAFKLLMTNLTQFVLVSCFSKVVMTLGKLMILGFSVTGAYFWLVRDPIFAEDTDQANDGYTGERVVANKILPVVLTGILAYAVASAFLYVYDLAISSILLCFCEDYKIHNVDDPHHPEMHKEVYMPSGLRAIVMSHKDHPHMQEPLTDAQILRTIFDSRKMPKHYKTWAEKYEGKSPQEVLAIEGTDILTKELILEICKKLVLESEEFLHLHIFPDMLTEATIIKLCGGGDLRKAIYLKNPKHDAAYAATVDLEKKGPEGKENAGPEISEVQA